MLLILTAAVAVAVSVLTVFGLHRASLARVARRPLPRDGREASPARRSVTVQVPLFNEARVAARAIDAACALAWPPELLSVQILDDSTDDTRELVRERAASWRARGVDVVVLRRADRTGYKAGALAAGTAVARGELLAVLDADFIVPPDFLARMVPAFDEPGVGMVQARWGHLNEDASLLTRAQAVLLDAHFSVEQAGRFARGRWFNFNGTAGIWRRACVDDAGGWQGDTLSEDVDLSYRAQLRGWRFVYRDDVVVPAELPESMRAFRAQQRRWTAGLFQASRKLLPAILSSPTPGAVRAEAALHLLAPVASFATTLLGLVLPFAPVGAGAAGLPSVALCVGTCGASLFFVAAQRRRGRGVLAALLHLPALLALGIGVAPGNTLYCVRALDRALPFERTPKTAGARPAAFDVRAAGATVDGIVTAALGVSALGGAVFHLQHSPARAAFLLLFAVGFLWVGASALPKVRVPGALGKFGRAAVPLES